jgi:hypothetical protein
LKRLDVEFRGLDYLNDVKRTRRLKELQAKWTSSLRV